MKGVVKVGFYSRWVEHYDDIFPVKEAQLSFLRRVFAGHDVRRVLDVGCGPGGYAVEMAKWGLEVTGVDLDEKMIEKAGARAREAGVTVDFRVGDMRYLAAVEAGFDAAICIGNTLANLVEESEIRLALHQMALRLRGGGVLVVQIVNYDRILRYGVSELPTIVNEGKGLTFRRTYRERGDGKLEFTARLEFAPPSRLAGETVENVTTIRPTLKDELRSWLLDAGFDHPAFYGAFDFSPHSPDSPATVAVATRVATGCQP